MNKFFVLLLVSLAVVACVYATPYPRPYPLPFPAPADAAPKETLKGAEALYYTSYAGAVPYVAGAVYPGAYGYSIYG